jgi:GH43 family beta-xylosidase
VSHVFRNPVINANQGEDHGDPFVLKVGDTYYLYHTGRSAISLYTSQDLVHWTFEGPVLEASTDPDHWAQVDLWAPEVFCQDGVYYLYVAGTRFQADGRADDRVRRQGIARAESPRGPFRWDPAPLTDEWSIDGHPFRDEDGSLWLFYNIRTEATRFWDGTTGCGNVVDRLLAPDRLEGRQVPVAFPNKRWEGSKEGTWYWNEGPCVLKRRGVYYQMYSGGFFADDTYGVGFATAPAPRGPWTKYPGNPILRTGRGIRGPGHHCVVKGPDGVTPYVAYHGYIPGEKGRKVHIDRLYWAGDRLVVAGPTDGEQPEPAGPVYDPAVPHWHASAWLDGAVLANLVLAAGGGAPGLAPGALHHAEAVKAGDTLRIFVDGVLHHTQTVAAGASPAPATFSGAGATVTSWLDDQTICELAEGASRTWDWGGTSPLEIAVAVRGRVELEAGAQRLATETAGDRFTLLRLTVPGGADRVTITAGHGGATVTDLVLTARS